MDQHEADRRLRDALRRFAKTAAWEERFRRAALVVVWSLVAMAAGAALGVGLWAGALAPFSGWTLLL